MQTRCEKARRKRHRSKAYRSLIMRGSGVLDTHSEAIPGRGGGPAREFTEHQIVGEISITGRRAIADAVWLNGGSHSPLSEQLIGDGVIYQSCESSGLVGRFLPRDIPDILINATRLSGMEWLRSAKRA